jgi:hypothetical protein
MNFIVVYVAQSVKTNLNFGLEHHVWGFKDHAAKHLMNYNDKEIYHCNQTF